MLGLLSNLHRRSRHISIYLKPFLLRTASGRDAPILTRGSHPNLTLDLGTFSPQKLLDYISSYTSLSRSRSQASTYRAKVYSTSPMLHEAFWHPFLWGTRYTLLKCYTFRLSFRNPTSRSPMAKAMLVYPYSRIFSSSYTRRWLPSTAYSHPHFRIGIVIS